MKHFESHVVESLGASAGFALEMSCTRAVKLIYCQMKKNGNDIVFNIMTILGGKNIVQIFVTLLAVVISDIDNFTA